jgi:DNA-binding PadR family transcriptional regulator
MIDISIIDIKEVPMPHSSSFLVPGQPMTPAVFHILLALADGDKHGYGIMKDVESQTAGRIKLGPGTLYGTIKRLLAADLITEVDERPDPELDDERRRYYRLTALGRKLAVDENERLTQAVKVARLKRLSDGPLS